MRGSKKIFLFFIFLSHFCFSENADTLKLSNNKRSTSYFNSKQFLSSDSISYIDNSLDNFQNSFARNFLGNFGLAFNDYFYQMQSHGIGFSYSKNNFKKYFYTRENLLFYDTHSPYTDLFYVIGSKKEQDFKLTFSYNVKKDWNITANFFRIRSDGFYVRQNTNDNFLSLSSNYKSKTNRYSLLFGVIYNNVQVAENGGIADDSVFEQGSNLNKGLLDVNLSSAKTFNLNRGAFIDQYFNLGKITKDSSTVSKLIPWSYFLLTTSYEDNIMKYTDDNPISGFYSNVYYDSIKTMDSTYSLKFENELSWKKIDNKKHRGFVDMIGFGASFKDQFVKINQREIDTVYNNIIIGAELFNTYSNRKLFFNISGNYCLDGFNKGDRFFSASTKMALFNELAFLTFDFNSKAYSPDFIYQNYSSNHFKWNNHFEKLNESKIGVRLLLVKYKLDLGVDYREHKNPVYFDNFSIARQYSGNVPVFHTYLKKNFQFFNWHLNNSIHYQYVPDSLVIRLPQFVLEHSLYYENDLFKKAMRMQIGASVFFVSSYYANSYMPATSQFYLQNEKKYGNYPFIDFFINAKIKALRVFFKIDHLNCGWMGNGYVLIPNYPVNDRSFKLGVSWRFYD